MKLVGDSSKSFPVQQGMQQGGILSTNLYKVRKTAKIRKRYNQLPHLTQDTTWESIKNTINITNKSQDVCPFPASGHKAAMNRHESMRNTRHKNTKDPQKKYRLGTVSKGGLKPVSRCQPHT